jgi:hypothetical protein
MTSEFSTSGSNAFRFTPLNQPSFGIKLEFDVGDIKSILSAWLKNAES